MEQKSRYLNGPSRYDDLAEEIQQHLEEKIEHLVAGGMKRDEAERKARSSFGNVTLVQEHAREVWQWTWLERLRGDLVYAFRQFRHAPLFTGMVLLSLSLGIGICAAMFTVLYGVLLKPMPYAEPQQLFLADMPINAEEGILGYVPVPFAKEWKEQAQTVQDLSWFTSERERVLYNSVEARFGVQRVAGNFFSLLGARPFLGRMLTPEDEQKRAHVAILSYSFWKEITHSSPSIVGQRLKISDQLYEVVGVMPQAFSFPLDSKLTLWVPLAPASSTALAGGNMQAAEILVRGKPGGSSTLIANELNTIYSRQQKEFPDLQVNSSVRVRAYRSTFVGSVRSALWALTGAVLLVWLIACTNVAGLLLARNANRTQEFAVRGALGASRAHMLRQLLVENVLLSSVSGVFGIALCFLFLKLLSRYLLNNLPLSNQIQVNGAVLASLVVLSGVSTIIFGLLPSLQLTSLSLRSRLHQGSAASGEGRKQVRLRGFLVTAEIALSLVLLVSAGLLLRTLYVLHHVPLGFTTENILDVPVNVGADRYKTVDVEANLYRPMLEKIRNLPGVESAALTSVLPLERGFSMIGMFSIVGQEGAPVEKRPQGALRFSSPELLRTMGMMLERGRFFTEEDTPESQPVVVVNHAFVSKYLSGVDPIGSQLRFSQEGAWKNAEIVGVLADVHQSSLVKAPQPEVHFSTTQLSLKHPFYETAGAFTQLAVRTRLPKQVILPQLHMAMRPFVPDFVESRVNSMEELVEDSISSQTLAARLLTIFAGAALVLSIIGLYGLLAYSVSQRTRELGVRIALGAQKLDVLQLILRDASLLLFVGLGAGVSLSLLVGRFLESFLFGVHARDLSTIAWVSLLLLGLGLIAAFVPARRAASIDPMKALRSE